MKVLQRKHMIIITGIKVPFKLLEVEVHVLMAYLVKRCL